MAEGRSYRKRYQTLWEIKPDGLGHLSESVLNSCGADGEGTMSTEKTGVFVDRESSGTVTRVTKYRLLLCILKHC